MVPHDSKSDLPLARVESKKEREKKNGENFLLKVSFLTLRMAKYYRVLANENWLNLTGKRKGKVYIY